MTLPRSCGVKMMWQSRATNYLVRLAEERRCHVGCCRHAVVMVEDDRRWVVPLYQAKDVVLFRNGLLMVRKQETCTAQIFYWIRKILEDEEQEILVGPGSWLQKPR